MNLWSWFLLLSLGGPQDFLNLDRATLGSGGLDGWELRPVKGATMPRIEVREVGGDRVLRVSGADAAGWFHRRLAPPIEERPGTLQWSWRVLRSPAEADLRSRERDDAPLRIFVVFGNPRSLFGGSGRIVFYTWGNREPEGLTQPSFVSGRMQIVRMAGTPEVGPHWRDEVVHPFDDYRRFWKREPPPITAVGVMQDTDMTGGGAVAELRELSWNDSGEFGAKRPRRHSHHWAGVIVTRMIEAAGGMVKSGKLASRMAASSSGRPTSVAAGSCTGFWSGPVPGSVSSSVPAS